jgi:hypothetical protein
MRNEGFRYEDPGKRTAGTLSLQYRGFADVLSTLVD